jgi:glycosyltransferase involved in cell wall biosynthesis
MVVARQNIQSLAILIAARHDPKTSQTFDRLNLLIACLRSVIATADCDHSQSTNRWREIQIILVDDNSPIPLSSLLPQDILEKITVIKNERTPGQAGALNHALSLISTDIFAFTDSDCVVARDWISSLHEHYLRYPNRVGVAGPNWLFTGTESRWKQFLTRQEASLARYIFASYIDKETMAVRRIDCRNLSLRMDFLARYYKDGFFQEGNGPSVSGQASVNLRKILLSNCLTVGYEPESKTFHKHVESLFQQMKSYYRWGRQGDYDEIYSLEFGSLGKAFVHRYLMRHFILPSSKGGVFWPYLLCVHGSYWVGIIQKHKQVKRV